MLNINFLKNKKIAILGLGINNEKLVDFLLENNLPITICDADVAKSIKLPHYSVNKLVSWRLGEQYLDNLKDFDIVFRSPGIPYLHPEIKQAKKQSVEISSQTKLFFELCPATIIGVTGTKGKGTTSTLIYEILKKSGKKVYLAGNIGEDPFNYLKKLSARGGKTDIMVLELSSFQLQDLDKSPHIAVVLNITIDHLDHHKDRKEYLEAKKAITKFQSKNDYVIVNTDYQDSKNFTKISKSKNLYFSAKRKVKTGSYYKDSCLFLLIKNKEYKICSRKNISLLGKHNLENVTAAVAASAIAGASIDGIQKAVKSFKGLEHRLEYIGRVNGVKYYNDSFSTTPETAIAAINSFGQPTILIAGGSDKGADFSLLANEIIDNKVKAIILIGDMSERILDALVKLENSIKRESAARICRANLKAKTGDNKYCLRVIEGCKTMKQIVKAASIVAEKGDIVLLSPACASFDMFENYKNRGEIFREEVKKIKVLTV